MHCEMFSSRPGFHPLDASSIPPPSRVKHNVSRCFQMFAGEHNYAQLRTTGTGKAAILELG